MSKKKNGNGKKIITTKDTGPLIDIMSTQFAVDAARQILGKKADDKWILGEMASALHYTVSLLAEHSDDIQRIAAKAEGLNVSLSIKSLRASTPPVVKVSGSFNEKHPMKAEGDAIDPEQMEMFGQPVEVKDETSDPEPEEEPENV